MISGRSSRPLSEYFAIWRDLQWRLLTEFCMAGLLVLSAVRPEVREAFAGTSYDPKTGRSLAFSYLWIAATLFAAYYLLCMYLVRATRLPLSIFIFDAHDLRVYFNSSSWITGRGRLYLDVRSEYPIFANLIFAFIRWLASKIRLLSTEFANFSLIWIGCAAAAFVWLLRRFLKRDVAWGSWLLVLLLAPATIYFSLFRYDIYPAVLCYLGLDCIRRRKWNLGAMLLGVCIALKGYALVLIPALFVFCFYQVGIRAALCAVLLALLPSLASHLAVFVWGGREALLAPYRLQVFRGFNGESTFDSLFFLGSQLGVSPTNITKLSAWLLERHIPLLAQSAVGLGVCFFRPSRFERFVDAAFLGVLGFMTFSVFYSPQYLIWLLPFLLLTDDRILVFLGILFAWSTYEYFPVSYDLHFGQPALFARFFGLSVLAVAAIRFLMIARLIQRLGGVEISYPLPLKEFFGKLCSWRLKSHQTNA